MPTYEYICKNCEHKFEEMQMMSAQPLKKCPVCKKNKLSRLFGIGIAVLYKHRGFKYTDRVDGTLGQAKTLTERIEQVTQRNQEVDNE